MTSCVIMRSYNIITADNNSIACIIMTVGGHIKKNNLLMQSWLLFHFLSSSSLSVCLSLSHKTSNNEKDREYVIMFIKILLLFN